MTRKDIKADAVQPEEDPPAVSTSFPKTERLCRKLAIEQLFAEGISFTAGRLWVIWTGRLPAEWVTAPAMATFVVPKRQFKRAVHRNRLRRRMKEAYRLHKSNLLHALQAAGKHRAFLVKFTGRTPATYAEIEADMLRVLRRLEEIR